MVLAIHDSMVELYGGSHGIRDVSLIQSAISRPQATFGGEDLYQTVFDKAAALFHSLLMNHAFVDANKRTSITAAAAFLHLNSYALEAKQEDFVSFPLKIEREHLSIEEISAWLERHSKKRK